ncbi:hypothetical protein COU49_01205, partial [Candidatus Nomurabacteria bacterium CG10_big_fil_rev_8_21_14_0_10_35_16]
MEKKTLIKTCVDCKKEFEINSGDLVLYEKVGLELSHQCFKCMMKQFCAFWVFGKFRKGVSDLSGESIITVLSQNVRYPVYKSHEWWGDGWDPMIYGQDYDSSQSFFNQLKELQEKVPRPHQIGKNNTNCDWCDDVWNSKNAYLSRAFTDCENISYGYRLVNCKDSFDLVYNINV